MSKLIKPLPLIIIYTVIIYLSLRNPAQIKESIYHVDKLKHFIAYLTLSLTIFITVTKKKTRVLFLIFSFWLSIAIEIIQEMSGYRKLEIGDGAANTLGLLIGALIYIKFKNQIIDIISKTQQNSTFIYEKQKEK